MIKAMEKCVTSKVHALREKCLYSEFFRSIFSRIQTISEIHNTGVWALIPRCWEKIFMMVDLIINIASETLTPLYVIPFVAGLAIILSKKTLFF